MKLLLDENPSRRLVLPLSGTYPGSTHVALVGLERATDLAVWDFAATNDYTIVTKDDDFSALSALRGHPPRVIKLTLGKRQRSSAVHAAEPPTANRRAIRGSSGGVGRVGTDRPLTTPT